MARPLKTVFYPQNPGKYAGKTPPIARSSWELAVFNKFDLHPNVIQWASESVRIPYKNPLNGRMSMYVPDLLVVYVDKKTKRHIELIEIKPLRESIMEAATTNRDRLAVVVNHAKWKAAYAFCQTRNMTFRVMTEKNLFAGKY